LTAQDDRKAHIWNIFNEKTAQIKPNPVDADLEYKMEEATDKEINNVDWCRVND
jgi:hypothetical protein